jgi:hypothetical protein
MRRVNARPNGDAPSTVREGDEITPVFLAGFF